MYLRTSLLLLLSTIAGCASLPAMRETTLQSEYNDNMARIVIVRPRVFLGDARDFEAWDGEVPLGTLAAGTLIEKDVVPGDHVFLMDPIGQKWGVIRLNVEAGKTYFLKPNLPGPFAGIHIGLVDNHDPRIAEWLRDLQPVTLDPKKPVVPNEEKLADLRRRVEHAKRQAPP